MVTVDQSYEYCRHVARSRGGVRCLSTAVTKVTSQFGNDEGLQMFVPTRMIIEKADASATAAARTR